ncbi:MAG: hypothetical protein ACOCSL_05330 [Thermoplasmatota archaeon]
MFERNNHFLDTNVIIGYSVKWDTHSNTCKSYFTEIKNNRCNLHTSITVENEARKVIEECRRLVLQAIDILSSSFSPRDMTQINNDLFNFLTRQFSDEERFSAMKSYIEYKSMKIRNLLLNGRSLDELIPEVREDFKNPIQFLNVIKNDQKCSPINLSYKTLNNYSTEYPQKYNTLDTMMENKKDRDIAFDAYHLMCDEEFDEIVLSSFDSDFVDDDFKPNIEGILEGLIIFNLLTYN